jgi:xylulose-5-phosphate/fructose-6-phosphate phosphoketolase
MHPAFAATLEYAHERILSIQAAARKGGVTGKPAWPAIVLRTPKGWTGPKVVDGNPVEGTFRAHQVPLASGRDTVEHLHLLEEWLKSYEPEKQFDETGRLRPELAALAPDGPKRMGALPQANGGRLTVPLDLPPYADYAIPVPAPGVELHESTRRLGKLLRDLYTRNPRTFRLFCPDETNSNRLGSVFEVENRCFMGTLLPGDDHVSHEGRVMEVLSEHCCQGWLEGYLLTGRHGLFATYEAFAMVVASMATQHAKWLDACEELPWRAPVPSLNYLLTSTCWRNDHNGFSHQGPGFIDTILSKKGTVARVYLPPDANCLLAVSDHCLRSRNCVNLIVIDKQPQLQWLSIGEARAHFLAGASTWEWAGHGDDGEPDVVLACAGDIVTMETVAAAEWLRKRAPGLRVRVVNVIDLTSLFTPDAHPHGMSAGAFGELFTRDTEVVFAFHGYPRAIHELVHGRPDAGRFHVRGFVEEGTTTTPFDMVVLNGVSRYHLATEALRRAKRIPENADALRDECEAMLRRHREYVVEHLEDMPEVRDWTFGG